MLYRATLCLQFLSGLLTGLLAAGQAGVLAGEPAARQTLSSGGASFSAVLVAADREGQFAFRSGDQLRTLPLAELVSWGAPRDMTARSQVLLADGGLLAAEILSSDDERLRIDSDLFGSLELPLEFVLGAIFHPPADARRRDQLLARLREGTGNGRFDNGRAASRQNSDRLILENGDELAGTIAAISGDVLQLKTQSGPVEIELERLVALSFNPSLLSDARPRGVHCLVGFSDGSRLAASSLIVDKASARVTLAGGLQWSTEAGAVTFLQGLGGKAQYLSDLPEESYRHVPYLNLSWPFARDASVSGASLRANGRTYVKGIGMHSASRLTFRLNPKFRRFEAEAAIDDETNGRGSVVFRVFVDSREAYKSPVIRGGMPPATISVDVRGGKRLSLIVDFAERGDELDRADWLNARLVP